MIEIHCAFRIYSPCRKPTYAFLIITFYFCCIPSLSLPVVRIFIYTHPTSPYQGSSCSNFYCSYRYYVTYWRTLHRRTNYFPQSSLKRYGMEITFQRPFHSNGQTRTHSHIRTHTHVYSNISSSSLLLLELVQRVCVLYPLGWWVSFRGDAFWLVCFHPPYP